MSKGEVRLVSLTKRFGDFVAVNEIDLDIPPGGFFSLLGPSGCGKTTTLRMIGGFEQPTSGQVLLDGRDMAGTPPSKRPVNTVFQSYALFPHLRVFDNVAFGLRRQRVPRAEVRQRVGEVLELVQLGSLAGRKPGQLSGGQQQRVALARALVVKPAVLLLDEPLGALDAKLRRELQIELKQLQNEVGITFAYVTHDQEEALTMSDRIAVLNQGRVEQAASPRELYEEPANAFVADFLGVSNLMDAVVVRTFGRRCRGRAGQRSVGRGAAWRARDPRADQSRDSPRKDRDRTCRLERAEPGAGHGNECRLSGQRVTADDPPRLRSQRHRPRGEFRRGHRRPGGVRARR